MVTTERDSPIPDEIEAEIDRLLIEIEGPDASTGSNEEAGLTTPQGDRATRRRHPREPRNTVRKISLRLTSLLVILAVAGTAFALTQTTLPMQYLELWQSQTTTTDFTVTTFTLKPIGFNDIDIRLRVHNDDTASAHSANVTVQLLNSTGSVILNETQATGSVAADGEIQMMFSFSQAGLVAEYESSLIVVDQIS